MLTEGTQVETTRVTATHPKSYLLIKNVSCSAPTYPSTVIS